MILCYLECSYLKPSTWNVYYSLHRIYIILYLECLLFYTWNVYYSLPGMSIILYLECLLFYTWNVYYSLPGMSIDSLS